MTKTDQKKHTYTDLTDLPFHHTRIDELFDGELISSQPDGSYLSAILNLCFFLHEARPPDLRGPLIRQDWYVDEHNVYKPDLVLAPSTAFGEDRLIAPPTLTVDVPRNRGVRDVRRMRAFAKAGVVHYWVADPDVPSITLYVLAEGTIERRAMVEADDILEIEHPFPVKLCPDGQVV